MDPAITTEKSKCVECDLLLPVTDDSLTRALDGLLQAIDNARTELDLRSEQAERRSKELAGV
jgi:hypothetical protein